MVQHSKIHIRAPDHSWVLMWPCSFKYDKFEMMSTCGDATITSGAMIVLFLLRSTCADPNFHLPQYAFIITVAFHFYLFIQKTK